MFARVKKSGKYQYLQIVENRKEKGKVKQRVIATVGRMDKLQDKGRVETLVRSLSRFSEKALMILSGNSDVSADALSIGPTLIFDRLWKQCGIEACIKKLLVGRKFEFDVERAIFLTVLHRLMVSGSDRFCEKWKRDYLIPGTNELELHHLYRAMSFLGEELPEHKQTTGLAPRRNKDLIEEMLFFHNRDLFSKLDLVFFDTTSIYFEGKGGDYFGRRGFSKDHRPDLHQMVVGAVLDDNGRPICCEMWPGNTTDVTTLMPQVERLRSRFGIGKFCIVADRGMISADTLEKLDEDQMPYILGTRMRRVKKINGQILTRAGRYTEVYPESADRRKPAPLMVKEVVHEDTRYIVCLNQRQARKDTADRQAIIESLKRQLKKGPKALVGNKGYRKYLKLAKDSARIDPAKIKAEARFDGKWVLTTNTDLPADQVALKYKELWRVERVFRDVKSLLETRPVYHQNDANIAGHVFCSFLALVLRKELDQRLADSEHRFEWSDIKQDLKALKQVRIKENGQCFAIRSESKGVCGKVFQSVRVALPPTIKELD
ncbi:MAG: IS1634 family transposase [Desulfobacteraceae bacterium]|nr:IS1634 family transposase [Desulfobacteraceae bacterium]